LACKSPKRCDVMSRGAILLVVVLSFFSQALFCAEDFPVSNAIEDNKRRELFDWALALEGNSLERLDRIALIARDSNRESIYRTTSHYIIDREFIEVFGHEGILQEFRDELEGEVVSVHQLEGFLAQFEEWMRWVRSETVVGEILRGEFRVSFNEEEGSDEEPLLDWYEGTWEWMLEKIRVVEALEAAF
jgi:hypothetical protein